VRRFFVEWLAPAWQTRREMGSSCVQHGRLLPLAAAALVLATAGGARADLIHRWNCNGPSNAELPNETAFTDSIGGAVMVVRGQGAAHSSNGAGIRLPGGTTGNVVPANVAGYLDLPNHLITRRNTPTPCTAVTIEIWATQVSGQNWQRLFDIGRLEIAGDGLGEWTNTSSNAPGSFFARDRFSLIVRRGGANNTQRLVGRLAAATEILQDSELVLANNTRHHYVATFADGAGRFSNGARLAWWRDGQRVAEADVAFRLRDINDVNTWLGRSQNSGDSLANFIYDEIRFHSRALTPAEILVNHSAGPDILPSPGAVADTATLLHGQKVLIPVLANDTGSLNPDSVTVVSPPQFGSTEVDAKGRVRYTHTTGAPASDSFQYSVRGVSGGSTATVTLTFAAGPRFASPHVNVPAGPPATAYAMVTAFANADGTPLAFTAPTSMASPPGDRARLFVCQKGGLLRVIPDVTASPATAQTFLDLPALLTGRGEAIRTTSEHGLLGLAFHPDYASNRHFFVFYSVTKGGQGYTRVARFATDPANPLAAVPASEVILLEMLQEANNHNGGCLEFGPDGYLYISTGDEGGQNDQWNNSQVITRDFHAGLLRIDVDKKPGNLPPNPHIESADGLSSSIMRDGQGNAHYAVPVDNPFVHASLGGAWDGTFNGSAVSPLSAVRSEFHATGLRNPWRFSFGEEGDLWLADVGGGAREEVNLIVKGGNYGWAFREGTINGPKSGQAPAGFDANHHRPPLYEYSHGTGPFQGRSVTGGLVYRGRNIPELHGAYIFCDYISGNVWSLRRVTGGGAPLVARLTGQGGIVAFGTDPSNGDVLAANHTGNRIMRLAALDDGGTFPVELSDTGVFADLADLTPAPGFMAYDVNLPFWSDHAVKRRWLAIPDGAGRMNWSRDGAWSFPAGMIWVKHFGMEMTRGVPGSRRRLETRLLVRTSTGAYGVSYRWNDTETEARLVVDEGEEFDLSVVEGGVPRTQRWRIPSRAECMACHLPQAGWALSSNTRQLNRAGALPGGGEGNWIDLLAQHGFFSNPPDPGWRQPRHIGPGETGFPVEARARSWLAVNCGYCHQPGSGVPGAFDLREATPLAATGLIDGAAANNGGNPMNRLLVRGSLRHSILYNRTGALDGFTRMPPLATFETDQEALDLLADWIENHLPARQTYADWRLAVFGDAVSAEGAPDADKDLDGRTNYEEFLAGTDALSADSLPVFFETLEGGVIRMTWQLPAHREIRIESSVDGVAWAPWPAAETAAHHGGGAFQLEHNRAGVESRRFFRAVLVER
jgi:glucose/arabinose dehydrogenase